MSHPPSILYAPPSRLLAQKVCELGLTSTERNPAPISSQDSAPCFFPATALLPLHRPDNDIKCLLSMATETLESNLQSTYRERILVQSTTACTSLFWNFPSFSCLGVSFTVISFLIHSSMGALLAVVVAEWVMYVGLKHIHMCTHLKNMCTV